MMKLNTSLKKRKKKEPRADLSILNQFNIEGCDKKISI